ncbi:uncharacterized protein GGS22DRAFT_16406 [Annulohypoxylon maeteangense]|uniref:uncharacterized protein n=1 Tax=Annulohypoxylon maeteangense TaxID=1927788 RepID=UPI002008403A|nr:uncharacterized protein GGS22DRAFT_16406 [Annulohypoxylon maeteangense]KAI0890639.1 hypothetical protein GGS22DRAFT_16406 [Annulohypoxylon maeteangense]
MSWSALVQISSLPYQQQEDILNGVAVPPPANIVPNLNNPPNSNTLARAVIIGCLCIVTIAILLRAYVKIFVLRKLYLEDALAFIGFAMILAYDFCCYHVLNRVGFLIHSWDISVKNSFELLYIGNMATSFYEVAISTLKVAILLEWNKIFAPNKSPRYFYLTCYILLWMNILYYITTIVVSNIVCFPVPSVVNGNQNNGTCFNKAAAETVSSTLNLVSHVLIFFLPQRVIWRLHMTTKKKIGVSLIFAIGILVVATGICRLAATIQYFTNPDTIFVAYHVYLWCLAEITLVILVLCVPTIPRIFTEGTQVSKIFTSLRPWSRSFIGQFRTNKGSTHVDLEKNAAASDNTYRKIEEINNLPLKNSEHWNGNRDIPILRSPQQL